MIYFILKHPEAWRAAALLSDRYHTWCRESGEREPPSQLPHTARHQGSQVHTHTSKCSHLLSLRLKRNNSQVSSLSDTAPPSNPECFASPAGVTRCGWSLRGWPLTFCTHRVYLWPCPPTYSSASSEKSLPCTELRSTHLVQRLNHVLPVVYSRCKSRELLG